MIKAPTSKQFALEMVSLETLVPEAHLLRKINAAIEFEFIREKVAHLYCANNGRPALDPVKLFKILFIGYLFGIRSERQLMREIQVNVAYRWFLDFNLTDKIPDASTLSQNRRRRFNESSIYQEIFDEIVEQAMRNGLVGGVVLYTDSTHLKASANKSKHVFQELEQTPKDYLQSLEDDITHDRIAHGKKPLKESSKSPEIKTKKISTTDPDAGYMVRDGKPKGFFYLDHRTVDGKHNIIMDSYATAATVHDSIPYLSRLDHQMKRFNLAPFSVGLDAGYFTANICKGLEDRKIYGVISYRRPNHKKGFFYKREFTYHSKKDYYKCPAAEILNYRTTSRSGYREYASDPSKCKSCNYLSKCTESKNHQKIVTRHVWQDQKDEVNSHRLTKTGKQIYKKRKETVERSFADAKELHGHRYARFRGLNKTKMQCLLASACQNMKKIALVKWKDRLFVFFYNYNAKIIA